MPRRERPAETSGAWPHWCSAGPAPARCSRRRRRGSANKTWQTDSILLSISRFETASLKVGIGTGVTDCSTRFERCGSPDRKDKQSARTDLSFADGAIGKGRRSAPTGLHCDVLRSVHRVGHRRRRNPHAGVKLPQRLAVGGAIGVKFSIRSAVKHQIPRCRQRSAAPRERLISMPHFAVRHRIPCDQASCGLRLEPLVSHRAAVASVQARDLVVKINFRVVQRQRGAKCCPSR